MAHKEQKKNVAVYLDLELHGDYLEACEKEGRSMAKQGEILFKKFVTNSKKRKN
jgi:hypothetical protein